MSLFGSDPVMNAARTSAVAGAWADVRSALEQDAAASQTDGARAILLAEACLRTGDPRTATVWLERATPLLDRAGDRPSLRRAINMRGAAAFSLGALDLAADRFGEALARSRRDDDALLTARATNNLGAISALRGQADEAIAAYQLAIPAYQRLGHALGLAESSHNLGIAYRMRGELTAADEAERRAIEYAGEAQDERIGAMALVGRADIALRRSDPAWAHATLTRAIKVFNALPDFLLESDALWMLADAADLIGDVAGADTALARSIEIARAHGHLLQEGQALHMRAQIALRRRDNSLARESGIAALAVFQEVGSTSASEDVSEFLAGLHGTESG